MKKVFQQWVPMCMRDCRGTMLVLVLAFGAVAMIMIVGGISGYTIFEHRVAVRQIAADDALHFAESGVSYYTWHLTQNPVDYKDGTGVPGPYLHAFRDKDNNVTGYFSLAITPPSGTSTVVTVRSTGWSVAAPSSTRTIVADIGGSSSQGYLMLAEQQQDITSGTDLHGVLHSNSGVRFYGTTDSAVQSAVATYSYENQDHPGIWGDDSAASHWEFPVDPFNFASTTIVWNDLKTRAQTGGLYFGSASSTLPGALGWHLVFSSAGAGSVRAFLVQAVNCYAGMNNWKGDTSSYWPKQGNFCYDIRTEQFNNTFVLPANGMLFVQDSVWIEGTTDTDITIAAAKLPEQPGAYADVTIPRNFVYENTSQPSRAGILSQGNILVPRNVGAGLTLHAAMLSSHGVISRPPYLNNTAATLYMLGTHIATFGADWNYQNGFGNIISGFVAQDLNYDDTFGTHLPPQFPVVGSAPTEFSVVRWREG